MLLRIVTKYKTGSTYISLLLISFLLMSIDVKDRGKTSILEDFTIDTISTVRKVISYTCGSIKGVWYGYIYLTGLREEHDALKKESEELKNRINTMREMALENERLKELLFFREWVGRRTVAARIIGVDPTNFFETVTIGKGSMDGVAKGMAVVTSSGVVGRVLSASIDSAKVMLITDRNSDVDVIIQRTRERGMAEGGDIELMKLKYVTSAADVVVGDLLVTSGAGRIFPKGLVIGSVVRVERNPGRLFIDADVKPAANLSRLEEVLVITDYEGGLE